jgi:hypothetical protein
MCGTASQQAAMVEMTAILSTATSSTRGSEAYGTSLASDLMKEPAKIFILASTDVKPS